jgi:hypothetical protein
MSIQPGQNLSVILTPLVAMGLDLAGCKPCQVGSVAGAAHLSSHNAGTGLTWMYAGGKTQLQTRAGGHGSRNPLRSV